jgi:Nicotinic acid phosphoribosyltransferase
MDMANKLDFEKYTDKYFLRAYEILQKENLNPFVRAQIFVRKGPGILAGMDEMISFICSNSDLEKNGGRIYALSDGESYDPLETILLIEAPILDIIRLETVYLGIISSSLAIFNDNRKLDFENIEKRMKSVVSAAGNRPVTYFGARHWSYKNDADISKAAISGGAVGAATDIGASCIGKEGSGTIPHALENIFAWKCGKENAVKEATIAFDRHMNENIVRVALIDYNNREIDDALQTVKSVPSLAAVRIDTCGENIGQGALSMTDFDGKSENEINQMLQTFFGKTVSVPKEDKKYWFGTGVSISGVYAVRKALNENGFEKIQIMLSSGFGDVNKIEAFTKAEAMLDMKLFDSLGVGGIYESRDATMDIVAVGESIDTLIPMAKVGRAYRPNPRLKRII